MKYYFLHSNEFWLISRGAYAEFMGRFAAATSMRAASAAPGIDSAQLMQALSLANAQRPNSTIEQDTGIAHISAFGPMGRDLPPLARAIGATDYSQLHNDFASALAAGARGVLLHCATPGGTVSGAPETADMIANFPKPVMVHVTEACSAGYWLASGADMIWADPSSLVGSIGIILPRTDLSALMEKVGAVDDAITNTGADLKGIDYEGELTADQRAYLVSLADDMASEFHQHVANNRAISPESLRGGVMFGRKALSANLIDAIGSASDARDALLTRLG